MTTGPLNPPPHSDQLRVSFPSDHVLLLTFNRPESLNAMTPQMSDDLKQVLNWFEDEPELWAAVLTGHGRMFCAGADLKAWLETKNKGNNSESEDVLSNPYGFGSISRRDNSRKPILAAVNGGAYGGGVEIILNCDLVVASEEAKFGLPEVKRGVVAIQGGIPRLARIAGHQFASELLLTGKTVSAKEASEKFRFVNHIVPANQVLSATLKIAQDIVANSPDAVQSTKRALIISQRHNVDETVKVHAFSPESKRVYEGENIQEGLRAFSERRHASWKNPAKL